MTCGEINGIITITRNRGAKRIDPKIKAGKYKTTPIKGNGVFPSVKRWIAGMQTAIPKHTR